MVRKQISTSVIRLFAIAIMIIAKPNYSEAQCGLGLFLGGPVTPACTGSPELVTTCAWAGDYITFNVIAGNTYTFSTCGGAGYDTQLTLYTPPATVVAYNDDFCGLQSEITWTATTTGQVALQLNQWPCATGFACTSIWVTCTTATPGPCASISTIAGCGTTQSSNMTGPGAWDVGACGTSSAGVESIWEFTATGNGIHSLDITGISGGPIDFMWVNALAGCDENAPWNCITTASTTGVYDSLFWQAGETYYILIDPQGTGGSNVQFNIDCPAVSGAPSGDCAGAIPLCGDDNFSVSPNNFGNVNELCIDCFSNPGNYVNPLQNPSSGNFGCLLDGELNSTWITINVAQGGTLEFTFGDGLGTNYYDWIMYPYDANTCTDIQNNAIAPISCNWNNTGQSYTGVGPAPGGYDPMNFEPTMNVNTGDAFVIMLSNWGSVFTNVGIDFGGTADISCLPLPVEMVDFNGVGNESYNELSWSTASEVNCSHFDIERSVDGKHFVKIGEVKGSGTSLEVNDYRFQDTGIENVIYYYRLKQFDFNGAYMYSNTIAIAPTVEGSFKVLSAYPNPATDVFNIQLYSESADNVQVSIKSANGAEVYRSTKTLNNGNNIVEIPVAELAKGMYMLTIIDGESDEAEIVKLAID